MGSIETRRNISISVHDYNRAKLCTLYDSNLRVNGQAYDIDVKKEANGWKELTFSIPAKVRDENNELIDNFRLASLKNEYLVKVKEDENTDWFYISEPNIQHNNYSLSVSVTCGHISSMLRMRNLYLELDDTNGIDTCPNLATTILAGTGWTLGTCDTFYEADGVTEKVRSMKSALRVGSYQMIQNLCIMFGARPTFNGDDKTVDIHVYNPFLNPTPESVPEVVDAAKVFELNYGKALKGITRKLDTSSLITKMIVEGSYGDDGYLGIESVNPTGLNFIMDFSYFESLGLFTQTHQDALDAYIAAITPLRASSSAAYLSILEKETELNDLWGSCEYACFDVTSLSSGTVINVSLVCSNVDEPVIAGEDDIVLLNTNGTHLYSKVVSGDTTQITIEDDIAVAAHTKVIVFLKPSSGIIGGKEAALIGAEKTRDNNQEDLIDDDPTYGTLYHSATPPESGMSENNLWVDTDASPITVWRYLDSNWDTQVTGNIARYAICIAGAEDRISNLLLGTDESDGLYELMAEADVLAREIYALYADYEGYMEDTADVETTFGAAMGDLLREGYWNNKNYVEGQEETLYADALDVMSVMSQPIANYSIEIVDLYEVKGEPESKEESSQTHGITTQLDDGKLSITVPSEVTGISFPTAVLANDGDLESTQIGDAMNVVFSLESGYLFVDAQGYLANEYVPPTWQDIDIDFCAHIIDDEIGVSIWGFVDTITKCYDKPWETNISVSTKKSEINGHSFADIMSALVAATEDIRGKTEVYDRADAISDDRTLSADALQGIIDVNRNAMLSSMSNWGTDSAGNIVFTSLDGTSAMMLTGMGFMIANSRTIDGDWDWRTAGTGDGLTADVINAGTLNAGQIKILGTDRFYWDYDNICIYDTLNPDKQIRIGKFDGVNYGIGFTEDGGETWETSIGFDGVHIGGLTVTDVENQQTAISVKISSSNGLVYNEDVSPTLSTTLTAEIYIGNLEIDDVSGYSFKWQESSNGGATWSDISGATSQTYSYLASSANRVRCQVSD